MDKELSVTTQMSFDGKISTSYFPGHAPVDVTGLTGLNDFPQAWSPPHFVVAAAESCFFLTLMAVAEKMKVKISGYSSSATAPIVSPDGKHHDIGEIVIKPKIAFANEEDSRRLPQLTKIAEEYCLVARSLKTSVRIEI